MSWKTPRVAGAIWGASLIIGNFKEVSMKMKRFFVFGLPTVLLALGLVLAGCDNGSTSNGGATATISGTPKIGETLTATFSGFSVDDIYWKSASSLTGESGGNISFGSNTYTIREWDAGNYIWVEANNEDYSIEVVSERVGPVTAAGPDTPNDDGGLVGTWTGNGNISHFTLVFTATTWTQRERGGSDMSGSYTYEGTNLTLDVLQFGGMRVSGRAVINGSTLTLSGFPDMTELNGVYASE
jgi:hypothetical protein